MCMSASTLPLSFSLSVLCCVVAFQIGLCAEIVQKEAHVDGRGRICNKNWTEVGPIVLYEVFPLMP